MGENLTVIGATAYVAPVKVAGVLHEHTGTLILHGAHIVKSGYGAAVEVGEVGVLSMTSGTISGYDLGVDVQANGTAELGGGSIEANTASAVGVMIQENGRASVIGSPTAISATGNNAAGVCVCGTLTVNGTASSPVITGNGLMGCGILVYDPGTVTMSNGNILGLGDGSAGIRNESRLTVYGGAIYGGQIGISAERGSETRILGGLIGESGFNISPNGIWVYGGSVETPASILNMSGGTVEGAEYGIGTTDACTLELTGGIIDASIEPGGIGVFLCDDSWLLIGGGTIRSADDFCGSGLYVHGHALINGSTENPTNISGGEGIVCSPTGQVTMNGGTVTGTDTWGIHGEGKFEMTGGSVSGNTYGIMNLAGATLTVSGGTVTGTDVGLCNQGTLTLRGESVAVSGGKAVWLQNETQTYLYNGTASSTVEENADVVVLGDRPSLWLYTAFADRNSIGINETNLNCFPRQSFEQESLPSSVELTLGTNRAVTLSPNGQKTNGTNMTLDQIFPGTSPNFVRNASGTAIASFTVSGNTLSFAPLTVGTGTLEIIDTVTYNGIKTIPVSVAQPHYEPADDSASSATVSGPMISVNGENFDPANIDTDGDSGTIEVVPNGNTAYVTIPSRVLAQLLDTTKRHSTPFSIAISAPYGQYLIPADLAEHIPGFSELLSENHLTAAGISFRLTLTDRSDDKDLLNTIKTGLPSSRMLGHPVEFRLDIINNKTGASIAEVTEFDCGIVRMVPMPEDLEAMPEFWGAFRYHAASQTFEFVPHSVQTIDGVRYVAFYSRTNSVYLAAENPIVFTDLKDGFWGTPYLEHAAAQGLIHGIGNNLVAPDRAVTRAEFVQMIANAVQLPSPEPGASAYTDVADENAWYYNAILKAASAGILKGFSQSDFNPNAPITRQEMAGILAEVISYEGISSLAEHTALDRIFSDYGQINPNAMNDVETVYQLNLMQGTETGEFLPEASASRAQAAAVILRLSELPDRFD
ncbi:MAG: S-layer homology domain-containing protein [Lawsonibacter sp.]